MLDQLRKNFEFDYWASDKFLKALTEMSTPPEKAVKIFGHVLFASDVWLARILKEDLSRLKDPYPPYSLPECRQKLEELHEKWKNYLGSLTEEGLGGKFAAPNTQGKVSEHVIQNVLVHVVNHSSYHRGQLAALIAQGGGNRPGTDYISYAYEIGESKFV